MMGWGTKSGYQNIFHTFPALEIMEVKFYIQQLTDLLTLNYKQVQSVYYFTSIHPIEVNRMNWVSHRNIIT